MASCCERHHRRHQRRARRGHGHQGNRSSVQSSDRDILQVPLSAWSRRTKTCRAGRPAAQRWSTSVAQLAFQRDRSSFFATRLIMEPAGYRGRLIVPMSDSLDDRVLGEHGADDGGDDARSRKPSCHRSLKMASERFWSADDAFNPAESGFLYSNSRNPFDSNRFPMCCDGYESRLEYPRFFRGFQITV